MKSPFPRPAGLALLIGLTALSGSAEAASFGANLNIRTSAQNFPQTVYAGGRQPHVGLGSY